MAGRCPLCHNKNPGMTKINFAVPGFFVPVRGMGYISRISASYNNPRQVIVPERGIGYIGLMTLADIEPSTLQSLRGVQVASPAAVPVSSKVVLQSPRGVQVASAKEYKQIAVF